MALTLDAAPKNVGCSCDNTEIHSRYGYENADASLKEAVASARVAGVYPSMPNKDILFDAIKRAEWE